MIITALYYAVGAMLTIGALLVVYRIVRGPSILDRMIASDVLLTTLVLVVGAEMVYNEHTRTIPLMVVLAATAIFATIAVARYVSKQDRSGHDLAPHSEVAVEGAMIGESPDDDARAADEGENR